LREPLPAVEPAQVSADPPSPMPLVSITVVTFNSLGPLPSLWKRLAGLHYRPLEAVIVDNASQDGSVQFVREHPLPYPSRLVESSSNAGYAAAADLAWRNSRGGWILLVSPDLEFDADLVDRLVAETVRRTDAPTRGPRENAGRVGAVSPAVQWGERRLLDLMETTRLYPKLPGVPTRRMGSGEVFCHHGACALVARRMLEEVGGFDPKLFLLGDEVDLALRAHYLGFRFYTTDAAVVVHPFRLRGRKGTAGLLAATSHWYLWLKHSGITVKWRTLFFEGVSHFFWNRYLASPLFLISELVWLVRSAPEVGAARRKLTRFVERARGSERSGFNPPSSSTRA
jgi:GT2 family glycosyltransferase